jgi:hypothetical protein
MTLILILAVFIYILIFYFSYYKKNRKNIDQVNLAKKIIKRENLYQIENITDKKFYKNILQTYKSFHQVPSYIINNVKNKNPDWEYYFYDDYQIKDFLLKEYGQAYVDKFDSFKSGAHKADLFRLCWLYKNGGVYIDIDMEILKPLDEIIENNEGDLIMPLSRDCNVERLFNAFIITNKGNSKIRECIEKIMLVTQQDLEDNYVLILYLMQETIGKDINYAFIERNINLTELDTFWVLLNKNNERIANCRYKNYDGGKKKFN